MRAGREGLRKRVVAVFVIEQTFEAAAVFYAFFLELVSQRNSLAVIVQAHQYCHVFLLAADA